MATATATIRIRRGTTDAWKASLPTLSAGEPGIDTTTREFKIGDGSAAWDMLDPIPSYTKDLTARDLDIRNLRGTILTGTVVRGDSFYTTILSGTTLSAATFSGGDFKGTTLTATDLSAVGISATTITATNLSGNVLSATTVQGATLCGTVADSAVNVAMTYGGGCSATLSGTPETVAISADRFLKIIIGGNTYYIPAFASAGAFSAV